MKQEELLKKLIKESKSLKNKDKLEKQIQDAESLIDDHCGAIIGKREDEIVDEK